MFNRLRELKDLKNIQNTLRGCANTQSTFFIWYKENDERVKSVSKLISVNFDSGVLGTFESTVLTEKNIDNEIFLFHKEHQILFKGKVINIDNDKVEIDITPKIFMEEKRERGRFYFKKIDVLVKIQVIEKGEEKNYFVNLNNISEGGMCFEVPIEEREKYNTNMTIDLLKIEGIKFPEKIEGHIVHITKDKSTQGDDLLNIGVKFKQSSPIIAEVMLVMGRS